MSEDLVKKAKRFVLEHNQAAYVASLDELCTPDVLVHEYLPGLPEPMDRDTYNGFLAGFRAALPDVHNSIEDVVAAGDRVVVRWRGFGTHTGEALMGVSAAGMPVEAHGIYILRFEDGRIAEVWNNWDNANVMSMLTAVHRAATA
jgi:predicted ester cyclase